MARTRSFPCPWSPCEKVFNRKSDLCRHYRIHTNERPYRCNFPKCAKSFIQRSALTVHSRTHTGEKPHICNFVNCSKAFSDSSSLARHRRIHTGRRPYKCLEPTCDRSFCRKTTLTKHQSRSHQSEILAQPIHTPTPEHNLYTQPPQALPMVPQASDTSEQPQLQLHQQEQQQQHQQSQSQSPPQPQPQLIQQHQQQQRQQQTPSPAYESPPLINSNFYQSQTQATPIHPIPTSADDSIISPHMNYINSGVVIPPQINRFCIPTTNTLNHQLSDFPPSAQRMAPNYGIMQSIPYNGNMDLSKCLQQPRMFNPYPERVNWDFLGLES